MPPQTNVASFILRFVQEINDVSDAGPSEWRGVIKHVQSNDEQHFTSFAQATAFIARYVSLKDFQDPSPLSPPPHQSRITDHESRITDHES